MLIGKIVKVQNRDHVLFGQEGVIVDVHAAGTKKRVEVQFTRLAERYFQVLDKPDLRLSLAPAELCIRPDYSVGTKAGLAYSRSMWHTLCMKLRILNPLDTCCIEECQDFVTARGVCNVHGIVYELDMCFTHYNEYNGTCRPELPLCKPLVGREYTSTTS